MREGGRHRARAAFTFVEMMIVIVILGTLLVLTIPTMKGLQERKRLSTGARELVAMFRYARGEAVMGEKVVQTRIDVKGGRYQLRLEPEVVETALRTRIDPPRKTAEEGIRRLPRDIVFVDAYAWSEQVDQDGRVTLEFYPNGTVTPVIIVMKDKRQKRAKDNKTMTIELARASGKCRFYPGLPKEQKLSGQTAVSEMEFVVEE